MNLRHFVSACSLVLVCAAPLAAHADTVVNINSTLVNGGTVTGTITFGAVTIPNNQPGGPATISGYEVTGDSLTVISNGDTYSFSNYYFVSGTNNQPYGEYFLTSTYSAALNLDFAGNTPLAAVPSESSLCTLDSPCSNINYLGTAGTPLYSSFTSYTTAADSASIGAPTPEPSSLVLLGTGILGAAGAARRRFLKK